MIRYIHHIQTHTRRLRHLTCLAFAGTLILASGCSTPVEIKQATATIDQAYVENLKLMEQYRELVTNITARHGYLYRYVQTRLMLDLALQWATTNPRITDVPDTALAEDDFFVLGPQVTAIINEMRLAGLPERKTDQGQVIFSAGTSDMSKLVQRLPDLLARVEEKVKSSALITSSVDSTAFDAYRYNVEALRRINGLIKQYLDIDVTASRSDVQSLAEALRTVRR